MREMQTKMHATERRRLFHNLSKLEGPAYPEESKGGSIRAGLRVCERTLPDIEKKLDLLDKPLCLTLSFPNRRFALCC